LAATVHVQIVAAVDDRRRTAVDSRREPISATVIDRRYV
jgi:hypothetical protein